jgi:hypothetical protein
VAALAAATIALSAGSAAAADQPTYGPEWQPGPDYTNFQPGPDYTNFQPGPDYTNFEPGANPGTADLVDDGVARVTTRLLGGLFR